MSLIEYIHRMVFQNGGSYCFNLNSLYKLYVFNRYIYRNSKNLETNWYKRLESNQIVVEVSYDI